MNDNAEAKRAERSADRVYDHVKLMAMTYEFRPGERINEVEVARKLNVSRTPVREALNRLSSEGYLMISPNRGFYGRLLDATEIYNLFEFRCALEQSIVRLACQRATAAELTELEAFVRRLKPEDGPAPTLERLRNDEEFHMRIARLAHNVEFERALEAVNGRIHFVRWIDLKKRGAYSDGHARIVRLLKQRDPEKCAAHMEAVVKRRYEEVVEVIRDGVVEIYVGKTEPQPQPARPKALPVKKARVPA